MLTEPEVRALAFDPHGGTTVDMPAVFAVSADRLLDAAGPLDVLTDEAQGAAVVAYESARRGGHGTAHVTLHDDDRPWWLEIFDVTADAGCFVAVIVPDVAVAESGRSATTLAPRASAYRLNITGVIESITPEFTEMFGWTSDEVVGESSMTLIHPDDHEAGIVAWIEMLEAPGSMTRIRQRFRRKDGSWLWCESTDHNMLDDADGPHVLGEILDVSREVAAESALQRRETVLDRLYRALPTGVLVLDPAGAVVTENERWCTLTGGAAGAGLETLLERVVENDAVTSALADASAHGHDHDLAIGLEGGGECRYGDLHIRPLREDDQYVGLLVTLDDTTEQRIQSVALQEQMRRDPLTGALNRRGLDEVLSTQLGTDRDLSVLFLDLDDFKSINDTYGHAHGDLVLCKITQCVARCVPRGTIVARVGGDEFVVILVGADDDVDELGRRIGDGIEQVRVRHAPLTTLGVSIGRADRRGGDDFDSLIARADAAMYESKPRRRRLGDVPASCRVPVGQHTPGAV
jgi:diguanylate cyclase (GGDEF)-like protein/PAS domain S-box-containing protein